MSAPGVSPEADAFTLMRNGPAAAPAPARPLANLVAAIGAWGYAGLDPEGAAKLKDFTGKVGVAAMGVLALASGGLAAVASHAPAVLALTGGSALGAGALGLVAGFAATPLVGAAVAFKVPALSRVTRQAGGALGQMLASLPARRRKTQPEKPRPRPGAGWAPAGDRLPLLVHDFLTGLGDMDGHTEKLADRQPGTPESLAAEIDRLSASMIALAGGMEGNAGDGRVHMYLRERARLRERLAPWLAAGQAADGPVLPPDRLMVLAEALAEGQLRHDCVREIEDLSRNFARQMEDLADALEITAEGMQRHAEARLDKLETEAHGLARDIVAEGAAPDADTLVARVLAGESARAVAPVVNDEWNQKGYRRDRLDEIGRLRAFELDRAFCQLRAVKLDITSLDRLSVEARKAAQRAYAELPPGERPDRGAERYVRRRFPENRENGPKV